MRAAAILAGFALAACNPMDLANVATKRAANSVVSSVLSQELPAPIAAKAALCVVDAASPEELRALAADIGVMAGSQTVANIRNLALRPSAVNCFAASAVPALMGGV